MNGSDRVEILLHEGIAAETGGQAHLLAHLSRAYPFRLRGGSYFRSPSRQGDGVANGKGREGLQADLNQENFFLPADVSPKGRGRIIQSYGMKSHDSCFKATEDTISDLYTKSGI